MINIIFVGIGGFIGCVLRYGVSRIFPVDVFPFATLISNIMAGFLIGLYIGLERELDFESEKLKLFVTTGVLGGLSTFSAFSIETVNLIEKGNLLHAGWNVLLNVSLCILSVAIAIFIVKLIFKK